MAHPLLIDTDCGIDDAVAILMALGHAGCKVVGVSTVNGNVTREHVTRNVCDLLEYAGEPDIPVFEGASRPLVQQSIDAAAIHGPTGLGSVELPRAAKRPEPAPAPAGLAQLLDEHRGATLVALGPLTNIALTLNLYPQIAEHVGRLVIMGGALAEGNVTKFAEFNFFADPEAAHVVLESGLPMTIVPWDACVAVRMSPEELEQAVGGETERAALVLQLQEWIFDVMERRFGARFTALPDPVAMACALDDSVVAAGHDGRLRVELAVGALRGASVPWNGGGVRIVDGIRTEAFKRILNEVFAS